MADGLDRVHAALSDVYAIEREIGRGGMATVYLAEDLKHHRQVAIKVLHPDIAASLGRERFLREIEIVANLRHRGILPLYDSGEADGLLFYVMPYVEDPSLRDRLDREKQLPVDEALRITSELAVALDEAHEHGVIHRDIKPANVLFEGDQPLIADFGVATALEEAGGEKLTRTGVAVGTPSYMSPEQAAGGGADARSDEYALACVLYEMLGGTPPFTGPTPQAVMARHALDPLPDLGTVRSTVPEGVIAAVEKAMAKVPADRYPSTGSFAAALEKGDERRARARSRSSRRLTLGLPVAALLTAVLAYGVWNAGRSAVPAEASKMAILPLLPPVEGDSALVNLGKSLSVLLAHNLNGVGEIETEPGVSMLSAAAGRVLSMEEAAELARTTFGASSVLTGTLVRTGDRVKADVQLHKADSTISFIAEASATAPADSVAAFANTLTRSLLAEIWRRGRAPSPQVEAALQTDSLEALKKFLEGEILYATQAPPSAAESYLEAFQIDSTFWLAAAMYASSWQWIRHSGPNQPEADSAVVASLREHVDDLPELQRAWVRAAPWQFGLEPDAFEPGASWVDLFAGYASLARDHWDFWPIVADFGDEVLHHGAPFFHPRSEAAEAFEHALDLNPVLRESYIPGHIGNARPLGSGSWLEAVRLARALPDGQWPDSLERPPPNSFDLFCGSLLDESTDPALADSLRRKIRRRALRYSVEQDESLIGLAPWLYPFYVRFPAFAFGKPRCLVDFLAGWPEAMPDRRARAWLHVAIATGWAGRGAWDSAFVHIRAAAAGEDPSASLASYRLAVAGAWLGFLDTEAVRELRGLAELAIRSSTGDLDPDPRYLRVELAWFDGMLAVADGDLPGLQEARSRIPEDGDWISDLFRRSLSAFELYLSGQHAAAADSLYRIETGTVEGGKPELWTSAIFEEVPVLRPVNRLALSQWLLAEGDTVRAEPMLHWHDSWHPPAMKASGFAEGLAYLELGRIHEAWGRPGAARELYLLFLRTDPIDDYVELAAEARAAVARIDAALTARNEPHPAGET